MKAPIPSKILRKTSKPQGTGKVRGTGAWIKR
jgi:hypothetical protein